MIFEIVVGVRELTEEISQAEVLARSPLLVINLRLFLVVIPTERVTHSVVLISLNAS